MTRKGAASASFGGSTPKLARKSPLSSYEQLEQRGIGSYGRVIRVKQNDKFYAMKIISKIQVQTLNRRYQVYNERDLLRKLNHPNVIHMKECF